MERKKEELKEVQGLANQLSEAGAAGLVEPRQLRLNQRWVEVEGNFVPFKRQCVSFLPQARRHFLLTKLTRLFLFFCFFVTNAVKVSAKNSVCFPNRRQA